MTSYSDETPFIVQSTLLEHESFDYDALDRDFTWIRIYSDVRDRVRGIVHSLRPDERILSVKITEFPWKEAFVLAEPDRYDEIYDMICSVAGEKSNECVISKIHPGTDSSIDDTTLTQLLLNSLHKNRFFDESNAAGRFFKVISTEKKEGFPFEHASIKVMEFSIVPSHKDLNPLSDLNLDFSVRTLNNDLREDIRWGKMNPDAAPRFAYDGSRISSTTKKGAGNTFVFRSTYTDERAHLQMIDWNTMSKDDKVETLSRNLSESRSVIVCSLMERFNRAYGDYLGNIRLMRRESAHIRTEQDDSFLQRIVDHYCERSPSGKARIRMYNLASSEYEARTQAFAKYYMDTFGIPVDVTSGPDLDGCNIPIIFSEEYYKQNKDKIDKHNDTPYNVMQHVTVDSFRDIFRKPIDGEPKDGLFFKKKIPLAEVVLEQLYIKEDIHFGAITLFDWPSLGFDGPVAFGIRISHNFKGRITTDGYSYFLVNPDGSMTEPCFCRPHDPCGPRVFSSVDWDDVEYAVVDPSDQLNIVRLTGTRTLPDGNEIMKLIDSNIIGYKSRPPHTTPDDPNGTKRKQTGLTKGLKTEAFKNQYLGGSIDIGYLVLDDRHWIYHVGSYNNLKTSVANASIIRIIEAPEGGKVFFDRIFDMMCVPFIKHNQNASIPFPVKYLEEWSRILGFYPDDESETDGS